MKYVSKKGETTNIEKTKGHHKNSLRKKRSVGSQNDQTAPLIVNYETSHAPVQDREQWLPAKATGNVIADSNLANFNIETLHDNEDVNKPGNDEIQSHRNDGSEENSSEHKEIQRDIKENDGSLTTDTKEENNDKSEYSSEEKEELRRDKSQEVVNSNESAAQSSEENSRENYHHNYAKKNDDGSKETEINEHHDDKIVGTNSKLNKLSTEGEKSGDKDIQDVDLNDFGYERIQLDKKGQVEAVSEPEESEETTKTNKKSQYNTKDASNYSLNEKSESSSIETNTPTHINDGEVKPVVELNSEVDSFEFNENNPNSKIEDESIEELTGVKDEISEDNDRLQEVKEPGDIKQQFERVPKNYKHGKENQEANDKERPDSESKNDASEIGDPKGVKYDENLNIKFGDLDIKLPEIKLPDDVISYAYEDSPTNRNKEKPENSFYRYRSTEEEDNDDEEEQNDNEHDNDDSDENNDYHNDADNSYYAGYLSHKKKQPYKKHKNENKNKVEEEDEDEDEDPYEKFVRERFGKRGNFEQRSQKLQNFEPHDPELYKTVQKVIEKTKKLNSEAAKSEDPNAGYMWTLEYGQKL